MISPINGIIFTINGVEYVLQMAVLVWLVVCLLVGIFFVYAGGKIKKADPTQPPKGIVMIAELLYDLSLMIVGDNLRARAKQYMPLFGTLIMLMGISNLIGLTGLQPPTSNLGLIAAIAVVLWILIQYTALKDKGGRARMKELMDPHWLLTPLNLIGELVLPLSLSMRLFGNILSGTIIMSLVYMLFANLANAFAPLGLGVFVVGPVLSMYFDIFAGLIQTYVFFMIASFFLGSAYSDE